MSFVFNNKVYERVPADAPEFERELVEDPVEKQRQYAAAAASQLLSDEDIVLPASPLKLMRLTQPRQESVLYYDEESGEVSVNLSHKIHVTGFVPYSWIPVLFDGSSCNITWFREKNGV